ncbi:threonyl-trna synthetase [Methylobacterium oryzae CBMB20]
MEAPFGLAWGPIVEVPRPVSVDREANLTALHYLQGVARDRSRNRRGRPRGLPRRRAAAGRLGGAALSGRELGRTRQAIHDEGVRRYGEPSRGPLANSEVWPSGRALLASRELADGRHELVMTAFGPGFAACSQSHLVSTGHPAGAHVADLVGVADH